MKTLALLSLLVMTFFPLPVAAFSQACHDYGPGVEYLALLDIGETVTCASRAGDLLVVGDWTPRLQIFDVGDPADPQLVETVGLSGVPYGVVLAGDLIHAAVGGAGLQIFERRPHGPALLVGSFAAGSAKALVVDGTLVYLAESTGHLWALDATDPGAIVQLDSLDFPTSLDGLVASGGFLVTLEPFGLRSVDVDDPGAMEIVDTEIFGDLDGVRYGGLGGGDPFWYGTYTSSPLGSYPGAPSIRRYSAHGRSLDSGGHFEEPSPSFHFPSFVATLSPRIQAAGGSGLMVVGFRNESVLVDPVTGIELGSIAAGAGFAPPIVTGDEVIVPMATEVRICRVDPGLGGGVLHSESNSSEDIYNLGLAADDGFLVTSSSSPTYNTTIGPSEWTTYQGMTVTDGQPGEVLWGGYFNEAVYLDFELVPSALLAFNGWMNALEVWDRATGDLLHRFGTGSHVFATRDDLVFLAVADGDGYALEIYDLTVPSAPDLLGTVPLAEEPAGIGAGPGFVYVWPAAGPVQAVDVTDPGTPVPLGEATLPFVPADFLAEDGLGYAYGDTGDGWELAVLDLTAPADPVVLGALTLPGGGRLVAERRDIVVLQETAEGAVFVDSADPASPQFAGAYRRDGESAMAVSGDLVLNFGRRGYTVWALPCGSGVADAGGAGTTDLPLRTLVLGDPWPNPFNPEVRIDFALSTGQRVELGVFDLAGRRVAVLATGEAAAGSHTATWNGRDEDGRAVGAGTYVVRLATAGGVGTRKVTLLK